MISLSEKVTNVYLWLMLGLFPLFTGFRGYCSIAESKWWFFVAATGLWMLALLAARLAVGRTEKSAGRFPPRALCLTVFGVWLVISAAVSPFGFAACFLGSGYYDGFFPAILYIAVALLAARHARPSPWHTRVLGFSTFLCLLVALRQLAGGNPLGLYPNGWRFADAGILYSGMYLGTIGNTLILCSVLSLALPWLALTAWQRKGWDSLLAVPVGLGLYVLWRCDGSSAWVALLAAAALALPLSAKGARRRRIWVAEVLLLLAGLACVYVWPNTEGTLYEFSRLLHGEISDSFGSSRIRIWRAALDLFRERPLFGGGPGTIADRIQVTFSRYVPETGTFLSTYTTNAHNEYLGLLVNAGIPALFFYLLSMALLVCRRAVWQPEALPLTLAFLAYAVQSFFGLGTPLSAPLFWLVWGLLLGLSFQQTENSHDF